MPFNALLPTILGMGSFFSQLVLQPGIGASAPRLRMALCYLWTMGEILFATALALSPHFHLPQNTLLTPADGVWLLLWLISSYRKNDLHSGAVKAFGIVAILTPRGIISLTAFAMGAALTCSQKHFSWIAVFSGLALSHALSASITTASLAPFVRLACLPAFANIPTLGIVFLLHRPDILSNAIFPDVLVIVGFAVALKSPQKRYSYGWPLILSGIMLMLRLDGEARAALDASESLVICLLCHAIVTSSDNRLYAAILTPIPGLPGFVVAWLGVHAILSLGASGSSTSMLFGLVISLGFGFLLALSLTYVTDEGRGLSEKFSNSIFLDLWAILLILAPSLFLFLTRPLLLLLAGTSFEGAPPTSFFTIHTADAGKWIPLVAAPLGFIFMTILRHPPHAQVMVGGRERLRSLFRDATSPLMSLLTINRYFSPNRSVCINLRDLTRWFSFETSQSRNDTRNVRFWIFAFSASLLLILSGGA